MNELISQIIPILITAILGVLAVVIKAVGDVAIKYLQTKKEEAIAKLGQAEYEKRLATAFDIWGIVDEHFRVNDLIIHTVDDKIDMFNNMLLDRIPSLTQEDLDYLRQTIAGQINRGREALDNPKEE
jgi:hypothetical protein